MSKKKRLLKQALKNQEKNNSNTGVATEPIKDTSPVVPQRSKIKTQLNIFKRPLTPKQQAFMELVMDKKVQMIFVSGPSGTTKTYLAVLASLLLMDAHRISDIIYVRSVVESADVKMGSLPGEKDDKLAPYRQPLMDKLEELLPAPEVKFLTSDGRIEGLPVNYLRGLNWNAKAIIADEVQNMTRGEIVTLLTRTGEFSKVFILGDPAQVDIKTRSGFRELFDLFSGEDSKEHGIATFEFTDDDILRSSLVKFIVKKLKTIK